MKHLQDHELVEGFEALVKKEKRATAEVVEWLKELGARKLYLGMGHTSLFSYLTKGLGYAPASAQRRIDAARLMEVAPSVKQDLEKGALNLTQVSILAAGFRQKKVSAEEKRELVEQVKGMEVSQTQVEVAKALDLPLQVAEKARHQKDESVRLEITLTKEEMEILQRAKEAISHKHPSLTWKELFLVAAREIQKKDLKQLPIGSRSATSAKPLSGAAIRRAVYSRDQHCQWINPATGKKCESRHQLEIDHIQPKWAGGQDTLENLQLLCATHNRLKFERCG